MSLFEQGPLVPFDEQIGIDSQHGSDNEEGSGEVNDVEAQSMYQYGYFAYEYCEEGGKEPEANKYQSVVVEELIAVDESGGFVDNVHEIPYMN